MNKKIIVLGNGLLGDEFKRHGYTVWGSGDPFCYKHGDGTYTYCWESLDQFDVIINCLGKTVTRWCESPCNYSAALYANGTLPGLLSIGCKEHNQKFVHISTGCLYDISDTPQTEEDHIVAHCNYTVRKWMGEQICAPSRDLIIRPRLLYNDQPTAKNLLGRLPTFSKLVGKLDSMTSTNTIVEAVEALLSNNQAGIFNVANRGYVSMYEVGQIIGCRAEKTTIEEVRKESHIHLVNTTMDVSKLLQFYDPGDVRSEITRCWKAMNEGS